MLSIIEVDDFLRRLGSKEGCNFRVDKRGENIWNCENDHKYAKAILKKMGVSKANVKKLLGIAKANGGHCDCEILFNAEDALYDKATN